MPLTPSFGDRLAARVTRVYSAAERAVLRWLASTLAGERGHGRSWWQRMMMRLPRFRQGIARIVAQLDSEAPQRVREVLDAAWRTGVRTAHTDLPAPHATPDRSPLDALVAQVTDALTTTHRQIPVSGENIYRRVIDAAIRDQTADTESARRLVVQRALNDFSTAGITGFVDRRGHRYNLTSYVEMAVRTAITHAEVEAYTQQALADGHDLIVVSDVPGACVLCRPFEGQVLSISGATAGAIVRDGTTGRSVTVTVMCSLAEARARGLFHPSCRHEIRVWTPDDPLPPRSARAVSDIERVRRRRRRGIERRVRERQRVGYVAQSAAAERAASRELAAARARLQALD